MSKQHLFVIAKITPKVEFFELAKRELLAMLEHTRNEAGCLQFELHLSECGCYMYLYEEWLNKAALEEHHQAKHTQTVAKKFEDWLSVPTEVSFMTKL